VSISKTGKALVDVAAPAVTGRTEYSINMQETPAKKMIIRMGVRTGRFSMQSSPRDEATEGLIDFGLYCRNLEQVVCSKGSWRKHM
jgi:hypothetical protein